MATISEILNKFQPREILTNLISGEYYELVFPFLLIFALLYTILSSEKIKLFRNSDKLNKAGVFIISLVISLYSVYFETSNGYTIGKLLSLMFPNISTLTILTLTLYVIGALFGQNFFKGMFQRKTSAFAHIIIGALGLGSVVFYIGIAMGAWDYDPYNFVGLYNVTITVALGIMAIVFMMIRMAGLGFIFLFIIGYSIYNGGEKFILSYFFDPAVFMFTIIIFLTSWLGTHKDKKESLKLDLMDQKETVEGYEKRNNGPLTKYHSKLHDISSTNYEKNKTEWDKSYPGESWEK